MRLKAIFATVLATAVVLTTLPLGALSAHAAGTNLITNPSVETVNPSNPALPQGWQQGGLWGDLTANYSYPTTGEDGNRSVAVQITSYSSGDAKWYFNPVTVAPNTAYTFSDYYQSDIASDVMVQYADANGGLSYQDLGTQPASSGWTQALATFTTPTNAASLTVFQLISAVGSLATDNYSLTVATNPTVTIVKPTASASVTGTVALSATATDGTGIKSLQFAVDGTTVGAGGQSSTTSLYSYNWDSTESAAGAHTLTAIATSNAGAVSQASETIFVAKTNLVPNPSLETVDPLNTNLPASWTPSGWGTNTVAYSYLNTGHTGSHSVQVKMTKYTDGDAKWYFTPQTVTPDTQYQFTDYYKATVNTEIDAAFGMSDGSTLYQIIGLPDAATGWTKFSTTFSIPQGAQTVTIFHLIHSVGTLTIDDVSLQANTPVGFNRPLVTLTFDDGYDNEYANTLPILQQFGFDSTQFIISGDINQTGYMTNAQVKAMSQAGQEIASHTVTHNDLLTETAAQVKKELANSQSQLQKWIGAPVTDFAFPNGLYDGAIVTKTKQYYQASRGVEDGLNSKDNFNQYDIKVQNVFNTTTTAQVQDWISQAQATNTWLVLVYHSVRTQQGADDIYNVTPAQLTDQLTAIKASGLTVETMQQALGELLPQLH